LRFDEEVTEWGSSQHFANHLISWQKHQQQRFAATTPKTLIS